MENQHRKIKGYRELSQEEIDLMNKIKEKGAELGALIAEISAYLGEVDGSTRAKRVAAHNAKGGSYMKPGEQIDPEITERFAEAEPHRWVAIAKTDFQTGLMALTRSIAQPGFF